MTSLSYWMKIETPDKTVVWEGMIYGQVIDGGLKVDHQSTEQEFFKFAQSAPNLTFMWEPVWEDVTDQYRLHTGSNNA